jgi:plasmid stabilization system protein ParE
MDGKIVVWSKNAEITFDEILTFYTVRNKSDAYSKKLYDKVKKISLHFLKHPNIGKPVENSNYREFIFDDYSIFYIVLKKEILITLFWDNRRDPKALEVALSELL